MKFEQGEVCIFTHTGEEVSIAEVGPFKGGEANLDLFRKYMIMGAGDDCDYLIFNASETEVMFVREQDLKKLEDGSQPADEEWTERFMNDHIRENA